MPDLSCGIFVWLHLSQTGAHQELVYQDDTTAHKAALITKIVLNTSLISF